MVVEAKPKMQDQSDWIVIRTKPRAEKKIGSILHEIGIENHVITYYSIQQWSDRKKKVEFVLIPGVIFVKHDSSITNIIYNYPQVIGILTEFGKPALVKQHEINNLLLIAKEWSGEMITQTSFEQFEKGDFVEVISGSFKGLTGELVTLKGKDRLLVSFVSLNINFTIELSKSKIKRISDK